MYVLKPEIRKLSESDIRKALASEDEDNLIVVEFQRLLGDMTERCSHVLKAGGGIDRILGRQPSCAMERVALELLSEIVAKKI